MTLDKLSSLKLALDDVNRAIKRAKSDSENNVLSELLRSKASLERDIESLMRDSGQNPKPNVQPIKNETYLYE